MKRVFQGQAGSGPAAAVENGGWLWISGPVPSPVVLERSADDCDDQMRDILEQLDCLLGEAGASREDVVKTVDYLLPAGLAGYRATGDRRRDYFDGRFLRGGFPASTGILMEQSTREGALLSLDTVAYVGGTRRETAPASEREKRYTFRMGVEKGGVLWLSGTTGRNTDAATGEREYPSDLASQVELIYERHLRTLDEMGYSYTDVVKTVDYLTESALPEYRQTGELRRRYLGDAFPVATGVIVNRLLRPDAMIEIDMVAVKGDREVINPGWDRYDQLTYVPGIKINDFLFVSGFAAMDPVTNEITGAGDLAAQTEAAYAGVAAVVEAAGASMSQVVKVVEYFSPGALEQMQKLTPARSRFLSEEECSISQTVVRRLLRPEILIEVEAVAMLS